MYFFRWRYSGGEVQSWSSQQQRVSTTMTDDYLTETLEKYWDCFFGSRYTIRGFLVLFGGIESYDLENT